MSKIKSKLAILLWLVAVTSQAAYSDNTDMTTDKSVVLLQDRASMPTAVQANSELSAAEIISEAHKAAGGELFVNPGSLFLSGYNIIRRGNLEQIWDRYAMWREFGSSKRDAHAVNGKIRIEAWQGQDLAMLVTFDGNTTYSKDGPMADQSANAMWSNSFGFGAIRNALDQGWTQTRKVDRLIDGEPAYMVLLNDPSAGETLFGIRQRDFAIVYVGFNTPRGWHERRYSNFFTKPGISWKQPGRVRLFYNGQKANEAIWTDFRIGEGASEDIFVVKQAPEQPSF